MSRRRRRLEIGNFRLWRRACRRAAPSAWELRRMRVSTTAMIASTALAYALSSYAVAQETPGLVLNLGRLTATFFRSQTGLFTRKSDPTRTNNVEVECGFYAGGNLVGNGSTFVEHLEPGSIAIQ
jgi:hypothetical protein